VSIDPAAVTAWKKKRRPRGQVERPACELLRQLAAQVPADRMIVELGAFYGRTTGYLALGASEGHGAQVLTVDPWDSRPVDSWGDSGHAPGVLAQYGSPDAHAGFLAHMAACGIDAKQRGNAPVIWRKGYADTVGARWTGKPVGLLWHDAEHEADAVEADLAAWLPRLADRAVVVLHDAGNPGFGVIEGAARVLADAPGFDWAGRTLTAWQKRPNRRGTLLVRKAV